MNKQHFKKYGYNLSVGDPVVQNGFSVFGEIYHIDFPMVTIQWESGRLEEMCMADAQASKQLALTYLQNLKTDEDFYRFLFW